MICFAQKSGVSQVNFLGLVPHGRAWQNRDILVLDAEENRRLKEKLAKIANDGVRIGIPLQLKNNKSCCYAGRNKLFIRYDGLVFGCEAFKYILFQDDFDRLVEPDSIYDMALADIYDQSENLQLEQELIKCQLSADDCGEKCPVQKSFRTEII